MTISNPTTPTLLRRANKFTVKLLIAALAIVTFSCQLSAMKRPAGGDPGALNNLKKHCIDGYNPFQSVQINTPHEVLIVIDKLLLEGNTKESVIILLQSFLNKNNITLCDIKNDTDHTALHLACAKNSLIFVTIILKAAGTHAGELIFKTDLMGRTALDIAYGKLDITNTLVMFLS